MREFNSDLKILTRLTIISDDFSQIRFKTGNEFIDTFDILSFQPSSEKALASVCKSADIDIISLDLTEKMPYFKHSTLNAAIQRGIYFEINYSPCIRSSDSRKNVISNCLSLIRASRGKNIIISSEMRQIMEIRGPYDVMNIAVLFGLNPSESRKCLIDNCKKVIRHADERKFLKSAVFDNEKKRKFNE